MPIARPRGRLGFSRPMATARVRKGARPSPWGEDGGERWVTNRSGFLPTMARRHTFTSPMRR